MTTTVYYVRHAQPNYANHDDRARELTAAGMASTAQVTQYLQDKNITAVYASPYRRAVDTVRPFAESAHLPITTVEAFRERANGAWVEDFAAYSRAQWADFAYKLPGGECLREVQARNIAALNTVLAQRPGEGIVIGGHGTALCTIMHAYNAHFGYADFEKMKDIFPYIVKFTFTGGATPTIEAITIRTE